MQLNDAPAPDSFYGVGKLTGENLGRYYSRMYGLEVVCCRIGTDYRCNLSILLDFSYVTFVCII
jgi:nucleoside-diphosphate-sugar epimerase